MQFTMPEYIEREAAIKELMNDAPEQVGYSREDAADCIRYMDAADVAPVIHAHWIRYPDCGVTKCSNCGWSIEECWDSDYCPNCGAQMDEKEDR